MGAAPVMDQRIIIFLGILFLILQFFYKLWDNKQSSKIILEIQNQNKSLANMIKTSVESFEPHIERGRETNGIVKSLKQTHEVTDRETSSTLRQIAATHDIAVQNQKYTLRILEKLGEKLDEHKDQCISQYTDLVRR